MQYFGRALGSVTKSWSSINPSTLSGAVDVIVVQHADGDMSCSPFHVRFGKFQIFKPSQKRVEVSVNDQPTTIPMKLSEHGEAYFVFETEMEDIPDDLTASPVASASSSPSTSPQKIPSTPGSAAANSKQQDLKGSTSSLGEPDFLDINDPASLQLASDGSTPNDPARLQEPSSPVSLSSPTFTPIKERLDKIKIPTKIDHNTGDLLLDIEGYKYNQERVDDSNALIKQILQEEFDECTVNKMIERDSNGNIRIINQSIPSSPADCECLSPLSSNDDNRSDFDLSAPTSSELSLNKETATGTLTTSTSTTYDSLASNFNSGDKIQSTPPPNEKKYIKTIRLASEQLQCLNLKMGVNDIKYSIANGKSFLVAKVYLWKWDTPIVISDIDGTITKSDAMGHVMNMIGKDWTHPGVAKLFNDIYNNGYNIMYLTARSAGLSDSTRAYLKSIDQDGGYKIPDGPVILSPDRTFTALKREVILKKPEVFKMACLNDIRKLYLKDLSLGNEDLQIGTPTKSTLNKNSVNLFGVDEDIPTPFIAGFGNRITDCISYRSVGIPKSRIFTINPEGEVHMELLELSGYKYSYLYINELVDHFFPPVAINEDESDFDNEDTDPYTYNDTFNNFDKIQKKADEETVQGKLVPGYSIFDDASGYRSRSSSVGAGYEAPGSPNTNDEELNSMSSRISHTQSSSRQRKANQSYGNKMSLFRNKEEKFSDVNFWREPLPDISDLSDCSSDDDGDNASVGRRSPGSDMGSKGKRSSFAKPVTPSTNTELSKNITNSRKLSQTHHRTKSNESGFFNFLSREQTRSSNEEAVDGTYNDSLSTPEHSPIMASQYTSSPVVGDTLLNGKSSNSTTHLNPDNVCGQHSSNLGQQIYLNLGSPLSSPRLDSLDFDEHDSSMHLFQPDTPSKMPKPMMLPSSSLADGSHITLDPAINSNDNHLFRKLNSALTENNLSQDDKVSNNAQQETDYLSRDGGLEDASDDDEFDDDEFED